MSQRTLLHFVDIEESHYLPEKEEQHGNRQETQDVLPTVQDRRSDSCGELWAERSRFSLRSTNLMAQEVRTGSERLFHFSLRKSLLLMLHHAFRN